MGKLSKVLFYVSGILLLLAGIATAYINLSAGFLLLVSGILLIPFTWEKINSYFSISFLKQARVPVAILIVVVSSIIVGVQLKGDAGRQNNSQDYNQYISELDKELNPANQNATRGISIDNLPEPGEMKIGKYYALIIGINQYSGAWPALTNAVSDARAVEKLIKEKYSFDEIKTLYDLQATRQNIIQEFEWLINNVKEDDNVLIYYSGHGEYWKKVNKGYWIPVDAKSNSTAQYLPNQDIKSYLAGMASKHTLLIADACFSGDLFRGKTESIDFDNSDKYYKTVYNKLSRQAISSGGLEPVMDGGGDGHSVFTNYLLKALESNNKPFMDAGELYNQIRIPIVNNSEQTPIFAPIKDTGDEGGQFIFINKNVQDTGV